MVYLATAVWCEAFSKQNERFNLSWSLTLEYYVVINIVKLNKI